MTCKDLQKPSKIHPKFTLGDVLGFLGPLLGPSWRQQAFKNKTRPKNQSSNLPQASMWEGFRAMLALNWAMLRSKSAWEPHLVNLYIKA